MGKRQHGHMVRGSDTYMKPSLPNYVPEFKTAEKFVEKKIKMLKDDFKIDLSYEDIKHLRGLKTERAINAAVRSIIDKSWR